MTTRKIGVVATIIGSFIEAAVGSSSGAIIFWLTLFWAAVMSEPDGHSAAEDRRFM